MPPLRRVLIAVTITVVSACTAAPAGEPVGPDTTPRAEVNAIPSEVTTATPTATPPPIVQVEDGDTAFFLGDYPTALIHYQSAYRDASDRAVREAAKWGEARTLYGDGRFEAALLSAQALITEFPGSRFAAHAYFLQGQAELQLQRYLDAADSWAAYLAIRPGILDSYTQERRGDVLYLGGDFEGALSAYTAAIQAPRLEDTIELEIKAADTRAQLQDFSASLAMSEAIINGAGNEYLRAQAAYEAGLVNQAQGQAEAASQKFQLVVETFPFSSYAFLSLAQLVEAGIPVDDFDRGLVDYHAGEFEGALAAFERYLAENPVNDGTVPYYRALALRDLGNHVAAIDALSAFIRDYSSHASWEEAWSEKAFLQWYELEHYTEAAATLLEYVRIMPTSPAAPSRLMDAARILERDARLDEAAQVWARVANDYPAAAEAPTASFLAGIAQFRLEDFAGALAAFNRSLVTATLPEDQARAYLWIGKTQARLGDQDAATTAWQQGQITDSGGYYSERARDLLSEWEPFASEPAAAVQPDLAAERKDAESWMRLTFDLPPDIDLSAAGTLAVDARFVRGNEYWSLGLLEEARAEFEALREAVGASAVDSYRLANHLLDLGLYRPAIFAARQVLTLAGLDEHTESLMAPPYFSHMRYGTYYDELVRADAGTEGLDPLLVFSMVRQESLFEGFVRSTAGARGLMQIVPGTGIEIANELGWPVPYDEEDLYRPNVSIRFGTHYLASNLRRFEGDVYAALVAYNSGPGNALIWKELAGADPDLFLEIVRFEEPRDYIRSVYEIYTIYRRLYRTPS